MHLLAENGVKALDYRLRGSVEFFDHCLLIQTKTMMTNLLLTVV